MLELYENIKRLRQLNGWSQTELALKVGYSDKSMISKIEKGAVDLAQTQIVRFAEVFGVTPSDLMGWNGESPTTGYYTEETAAMAQKLFENKELRILFDAAKDCKPEDLQMAADLLARLKQTNPDG